MKHILGLDLGTNSIGWAVIGASDDYSKLLSILGVGSRIIPMDAGTLSDFNKGASISKTAERTRIKGIRTLIARRTLRRERLNRALNILNFLPPHYASCLDRYGKIKEGEEPKIAWAKNDDGIYHFLFKDSFNEMITEMKSKNPSLSNKLIPYDWTIYYLRKKALTEKISKEELAWVLLNFNQKRGYYQLRGEESKDDDKREEYYELKVTQVEASEEKTNKETWYNIHLENGLIYRRKFKEYPDWEGKIKPFIITTHINKNGSEKLNKNGEIKRDFRSPSEDDWALLKKKSEHDIDASSNTIGEYIYNALCNNHEQKIRGGLVRVIDRKYYKEELEQILRVQSNFHPEFQDRNLYNQCIESLYNSNIEYRASLQSQDLIYLFIDDILFYHRPLKSCKHLISNCQYESRFDKSGKMYGVKCIPKSHPLYAEFRIWQFIYNLRIYCNQKVVDDTILYDIDVTKEFLKNEADYANLFEQLYALNSVNQNTMLNLLGIKKDVKNYRWNYVPDKEYPCNETRHEILTALKECSCNRELSVTFPIDKNDDNDDNIKKETLPPISVYELWHILYSINDKQELYKALCRFTKRNKLPKKFAEVASKIKPFAKEYGSYSYKAIQKLLPLMRMGKYWKESDIDNNTRDRINKIISGEFDSNISDRVREKVSTLNSINNFKGLPLWLACYIVYNRHSETKDANKWYSYNDIITYINEFKQHSLRNPIVEQIIIETLRTVADIWKKFGTIDEIHIELGRELKNPADKRAKITKNIQENEETNIRIKRMLRDFMNPELEIENIRLDSPYQQEILKIYEEFALDNSEDNEETKEIKAIINKYKDIKNLPTAAEVKKYKLWLEQKYRSPYTGKIIPLGKLFTPAYEIEHIIPQSRYFDDSLSNKVICESEVNKLKDNYLGLEFIKEEGGRIVETSSGKVTIFKQDEYEKNARDTFGKSGKTKTKLKKLLMSEIPDDFIARQLNDSRYISKFIKGLLSNIVRDENEMESTSKHLIVCSGGVTDRLKKDWGVNDKWNEIILPRFERLNSMLNTNCYTYTNNQGNLVPCVPLEFAKGFNKKRIDHRHHAMDAIVIACATREHINLINNESALSKNKENRYALQQKLRRIERKTFTKTVNGKEITKTQDVAKEFLLPWENFPQDVYNTLRNIVVSFKSKHRIINKTSNKYYRFIDGVKKLDTQTKGDMLVVRKPLHKDTYFGKVNLKLIKEANIKEVLSSPHMIVDKSLKELIKGYINNGLNDKTIKSLIEEEGYNSKKIQLYYFTNDSKEPMVATRKDLISLFADTKDINKVIKKIESITDTGIQIILKNHLINENNNPELAFSPEGIDRMNQNIASLNNGKPHLPIQKVRYSEILGAKYPVGTKGTRGAKFVEAADDTNIFLGIYIDNNGKRKFETIQLITAVSLMEQGLPPVPITDKNGNKLLYTISPNDLVYVPTPEEIENNRIDYPLNPSRIYKTMSFSKSDVYFIPSYVSKVIINKVEYEQLNKMQRAITGEMIKEVCIPIRIDRLGNIEIINF